MKRDAYGALTGSAIPAPILRASSILKLAGNIGFWAQIVLGVVAAVILLFASAGLVGGGGSNSDTPSNFTQGTTFGLLCACLGVAALVVSIFFFFRYRTIARLMLTEDSNIRPRKSYTLQTIKFGLLANLLGMTFAIIGAESLVGLVLGKSLLLPTQANAAILDASRFILPQDLMIILGNTHTIASHFTGIIISLWLLDRLSK